MFVLEEIDRWEACENCLQERSAKELEMAPSPADVSNYSTFKTHGKY